MAASIAMSTMGIRMVLQCAMRAKSAQLSATSVFILPVATAMQVRHRNKKQRVREAKVDVDKSQKYIPKKQRKKALIKQTAAVEESRVLADAPVDNVWIRKHYPTPHYSIEEAIERHKSFAQPAMLNNMEGLLFLDMKLDFTMKKKTKFMGNIRSTLRLPHEFPYGTPPDILVFTKSEENLTLANSLGAKSAGPPEEIIKMITTGVINPKDFHHVLCTVDCGNEILPVRSHFRDKFPQRAKGNLGADLTSMWNLFYFGYTYESQKLSDAVGRLQVPFGLLEQPTEELKENFQTYVENVCQHRSIALGPFITAITVVAPPSPEEFMVKVEDYVPGYQNEEVDSDDEDEAAAVD